MYDDKNDRKEKVKELYGKLKDGLNDFQNSTRYAEFLRFASKFHSYSFGNMVLIWLQRREASRVAGYRTWQSLGRQVKGGERGIGIFAPLTYKTSIRTEKDGIETEEETRIVKGFRAVYVFDIAQTEGDPLPEICATLGDDANGERVFKTLRNISPVPVIVEKFEGLDANGYYIKDKKEIHIRDDLTTGQKAKTLIHEFAHCLAERESGSDDDKDTKEIIAESVAFLVCSHYDIDSSGYSFGYISSYNGNTKKLLEVGEVVQRLASEIIDSAEDADNETGTPNTATAPEGVSA